MLVVARAVGHSCRSAFIFYYIPRFFLFVTQETWQWPRSKCIKDNMCGRKRQSPINIEKYTTVYDSNMAPLSFSGYDNPLVDYALSTDGSSGNRL